MYFNKHYARIAFNHKRLHPKQQLSTRISKGSDTEPSPRDKGAMVENAKDENERARDASYALQAEPTQEAH